MKPVLFGKTLSELEAIVTSLGAPKFAGRQVAQWLYRTWVDDIDAMTNLSQGLRAKLKDQFELGLTLPSKVDASTDGTKKYLFPAAGKFIESAYIPEDNRKTLCLSSQVGCKMGCLFCMTGKQGFQANLTPGEILNQVRSLPEGREISHIVYMGMGEPFDNLDNVLKSLEIFTADWGFGLSAQKITVSTIGIIPAIKEFMARSQCRLALSLHSPFNDERKSLMPIQTVYPLEDILGFLKDSRTEEDRRLSIEYICFGGLNDTPRHAKELVRILHGLKVRVNLIRFHPIPGTPLVSSDEATMLEFRDSLTAKGIHATIRRSRGQDIWAACGLLSTKALVKNLAEDY